MEEQLASTERGLKQTMENEIGVMTAMEFRMNLFFFRPKDNHLDLEIILAHIVRPLPSKPGIPISRLIILPVGSIWPPFWVAYNGESCP